MPDSNAAPRTPPHDLQAEMGVLGAMLLSMDATFLSRERLSENSFYKLSHQDIFRAVVELSESHKPIDLILLRDELNRQGKLEKVGGVAYLTELMGAVPTSANAEYYIEIVRERAIRRHLIQTAGQIQKRAYENSQEVDGLLDEAESDILGIRHRKDTGEPKEVHQILQGIMARLEELQLHPGFLTGLASGYYDLDDLTGGFQPGEFIVLAARPSVGKTTLALNILHHVCHVERKPAAFFSLEMSAEQIVSNFLCLSNKLDTHDFRRGKLHDKDWARLEASLDDLVDLPLFIDDSPTLSVLDLRARARRLALRHEIRLVIVDYLQLVGSPRRHDNRANEVAEISRGLKALARELAVPLVAVAQLSRRVEQEQRPPRLSDLRESGAIEQDADLVLLLHRPQELLQDEATGELKDIPKSEANLIVAKQRSGPTGLVRLIFEKRYLRFESRASQPGMQ